MFDQHTPRPGEVRDVYGIFSRVYTRLSRIESLVRRHGWSASFRQLKPGPLHVRSTLTASDSATVVDMAVSHGLEIMGRTRRDMIAVVLPVQSTHVWLNGHTLTAGNAIALPADCAVAAWSSDAARVLLTLIPLSAVQSGRCFDRRGAQRLFSGETVHLNVNPAGYERLRAATISIPQRPTDPGAFVSRAEMAVEVRRQVLDDFPTPVPDSASFRVIRRAAYFVDANLADAISMNELSNAAAMSLSRLERTFRRQLGITPSRYLLARKLVATRNALRKSPAGESTVTTIAFEHGFNHLGRFSAAYRKHFGVLPSETERAT